MHDSKTWMKQRNYTICSASHFPIKLTIRDAWNCILNSEKKELKNMIISFTLYSIWHQQAITEKGIPTMRTIFDIIVLEPVEEASILKGPSWNRNLFGQRNRSIIFLPINLSKIDELKSHMCPHVNLVRKHRVQDLPNL